MPPHFSHVPDPAVSWDTAGLAVAFPPDDTFPYFAYVRSGTPTCHIYKQQGDLFTLVQDIGAASLIFKPSFTANAAYLAIAGYVPRLAIYKRAGDVFSDLGTVWDVGPGEDSLQASFSTDASRLAVACLVSPYLYLYTKTAGVDAWTKDANPATLPTGAAWCCALAWDGNYAAVGHENSPYVSIYKYSGGAWSKLADPAVLPAGIGMCCALSSSAAWLVVGHENAPYVSIYKRYGDAFEKVADPDFLPTGQVGAVAISSDSRWVACMYDLGAGAGSLILYHRDGDTFTRSDITGTLPNTFGIGAETTYVGLAFSMGGKYLAAAVHSPSEPPMSLNIYKKSGIEVEPPGNPARKGTPLPPTEPSPIMLPAQAWGKLGRGTIQPFRDPRQAGPVNTSWKCPADSREPRPGDHIDRKRLFR